jgi:hypothetical protein
MNDIIGGNDGKYLRELLLHFKTDTDVFVNGANTVKPQL